MRSRPSARLLFGLVLAAGPVACDPDPGTSLDASTRDASTRDSSLDGSDAAPNDTVVPPADNRPGFCGDGVRSATEACDDANTRGADGCSADCMTVEPGYACPTAGARCTLLVVCGDGFLARGEACDDRNTRPGDGCSEACALEPGWACATPGVACRAARCGDGVRVDVEECDDGDAEPGDGCDAQCRLEEGYACATPGSACARVTCGNRMTEGAEQCDDGNRLPGDGCDPFCRREPRCTDGTCMSVCGDGVRQTGEACDDGNTRADDGCSPACAVEAGFRCGDTTPTEPASLLVPIIYRDFRGHDLPGGHADFEDANGGETGIVRDTLDGDRLVYARDSGGTNTTHGRAGFDQWYRDTPMVNVTIADRLTMMRTGPGTYVFDDDTFFPIDDRGWVAMMREDLRNDGDGTPRNFSFTSELRYWFAYRGGERLTFRGDDDVWVFINGHLAVDLGGVHGAQDGETVLDDANARRFGLRAGGVYMAIVFQAERHTSRSSYRLTLAGFNAPRSTCESVCGDGVVSRFEACDDGMNNGAYGGCMPGCRERARFCGDGMQQRDDGEECDDGNSVTGDGCSATCHQEAIG